VRACRNGQAPHTMRAIETSQARKFGPTPD
jgi:hypothetical protein